MNEIVRVRQVTNFDINGTGCGVGGLAFTLIPLSQNLYTDKYKITKLLQFFPTGSQIYLFSIVRPHPKKRVLENYKVSLKHTVQQ